MRLSRNKTNNIRNFTGFLLIFMLFVLYIIFQKDCNHNHANTENNKNIILSEKCVFEDLSTTQAGAWYKAQIEGSPLIFMQDTVITTTGDHIAITKLKGNMGASSSDNFLYKISSLDGKVRIYNKGTFSFPYSVPGSVGLTIRAPEFLNELHTSVNIDFWGNSGDTMKAPIKVGRE